MPGSSPGMRNYIRQCELPHIGGRRLGLSSRGRRAIVDGGRSPTMALWAFPPSTWPRGSGLRGLFRLSTGSRTKFAARADSIQRDALRSRRAFPGAKSSAPARRPARNIVRAGGPASVAQARRVRHLFPARQAFGDDLGRLQRRLAQGGILDDLALYPRALVLQHVTQRLQLGDELVDLLH
jgi:hypothetical protein